MNKTLTAGSVDEIFDDRSTSDSLITMYKRQVFESLVTSFGLDMFIRDQHGGDVDTVHNVRKIGDDPEMTWKNQDYARKYENRGEYDSSKYHQHENYRRRNKEGSEARKNGGIEDGYTGQTLGANDRVDLDHVKSAKEIHDDQAVYLTDLKGEDLANSDENLVHTNARTNRSKKDKSMDEFLDKKGDEYTPEQQERMREADRKARKAIDRNINLAYYTKPQFMIDTAYASAKTGVLMGARQAVGFIVAEIWFSVSEQVSRQGDARSLLSRASDGLRNGLERARDKYAVIFSRFVDGAVAGALSSLVTTLINIFATTAKRVVNILRQTFTHICQALKILVTNPDNLSPERKYKAAAIVMATGLGVVLGGLINEALNATALGTVPVVGEILTTFCSTLAAGIITCTLIYAIENVNLIDDMRKLILDGNPVHEIEDIYMKRLGLMDELLSKLDNMQTEEFARESRLVSTEVMKLRNAKDSKDLVSRLFGVYNTLKLALPFGKYTDPDEFMRDAKAVLKFRKAPGRKRK